MTRKKGPKSVTYGYLDSTGVAMNHSQGDDGSEGIDTKKYRRGLTVALPRRYPNAGALLRCCKILG